MSSSSKGTTRKGQSRKAGSSPKREAKPAEQAQAGSVKGSRLGAMRAFAADPELLEAQAIPEQQSAPAASEPPAPAAAAPVEAAAEAPVAERPAPAARARRGGAPASSSEAPAMREELEPGVEKIGEDLFVRDQGKLLPVDAVAKMTFSFTALERHRLRQYADARRMDYVEVIRERLADILSGEER